MSKLRNAFLLFALPALALAACDAPPNAKEHEAAVTQAGVLYALSDDGASYIVTGYEGAATAIVIPEAIGEVPVTAIGGNAFLANDTIVSVALPASVSTIGPNAFANCASLREISLPDALTAIEYRTFYGCTSLYKIELGPNLKSIQPEGFWGCASLLYVDLPSSLEFIGYQAFMDCVSLVYVSLPSGVVHIGERAFAGTNEHLVILYEGDHEVFSWHPQWNEGMGEYSGFRTDAGIADGFAYMVSPDGQATLRLCLLSNAETIHIPAVIKGHKVTYIDTRMGFFAPCEKVKSITIDPALTEYEIRNNCLLYKRPLSLVAGIKTSIIPEDPELKIIREGAFCRQRITFVAIPKNIEVIEAGAFYGCDDLRVFAYAGTCEERAEIDIRGGNNKLLDAAFIPSFTLSSLRFVESREWSYLLADESKILDLVAKDPIDSKTIDLTAGEFADKQIISLGSKFADSENNKFFKETPLENLILPEGLLSLNDSALATTHLLHVSLPKSLRHIGSNAFASTPLKYLCFAGNAAEFYELLMGIEPYNDVLNNCELTLGLAPRKIVTKTTEKYVYGLTDQNDIVALRSLDKNLKVLDLVDGPFAHKRVISLASEAFADHDKLTSVYLSKEVTTLGGGAFIDDDLLEKVEVESGSKLSMIPGYAFADCPVLEDVELPASLTHIYPAAFLNCKALASPTLPAGLKMIDDTAFYGCKAIKKIVLPDSLELLGYEVFYGCEALEDLKIGKGLKEIESRTFVNCFSLEKVIIPDNIEYIGTKAFLDCSKIHTVRIGNGVKEIASEVFAGCNALRNIVIPLNVEVMGSNVFAGIPNGEDGLIIKCVAEEKPVGWSSDWDGGDHIVMWDAHSAA